MGLLELLYFEAWVLSLTMLSRKYHSSFPGNRFSTNFIDDYWRSNGYGNYRVTWHLRSNLFYGLNILSRQNRNDYPQS